MSLTQPFLPLLVISDDSVLSDDLADHLASHALVPVLARQAVAPEVVSTLRPAAILLDAPLWAADIPPLIGELRSRRCCPILVLTEGAREAERILALELGADDVMQRPIGWPEVMARLRAHLRRARALPDAAPDSAPDSAGKDPAETWRVLRTRRQLLAPAGEPVALTAAEFDLLAALGEQPGMPLSRAALTQRVLKRPLHDDDRSIDNLVYQVHRKLHPHGGEALLTTVRNQGYASAIPLVRD